MQKNTLANLINLDLSQFIIDKNFNYNEAMNEAKNIKYKYSKFFMAIYNEKNNTEILDENNEHNIFIESINSFKDTMIKIIYQKDTKEPFFKIPNIIEIMNIVKQNYNNLNEEISFISKEFVELNKDNYIEKDLLNDLIIFSKKEKIQNLIEGIYSFNNTLCNFFNIKITSFNKDLFDMFSKLNSNEVSGENIKKANSLLKELNFNINEETSLMNFYNIFLGKQESLTFIKSIKDKNIEIRNLNEFIDLDENSQIKMSDIDNLFDVYTFFISIIEDKKIKNDKNLFEKFKTKFEQDKNINIKLLRFLNSYGEMYQLFQLYDENSEMATEKILNILKNSLIEIYKTNDNEKEFFTYNIYYFNNKKQQININPNEIDELKNRILISSTTKTENHFNEKGEKEMNKKEMTNKFVDLIENIQRLIQLLNRLFESGYPYIENLILQTKDSNTFDTKNKNKNLENIMESYKIIINDYDIMVKEGYQKYPLLRLFYGKNFIKLFAKINNKDENIYHLVNSVALNKIKNLNINFKNNKNKNIIENINEYIKRIFEKNNCDLKEIYNQNKISKNLEILPGIYMIAK